MDTADSAALVEEMQLIIAENLLVYSETAVRKYRKVHEIGQFSKGCKGYPCQGNCNGCEEYQYC